ncbi:TPA: hypothetical protein HH295_17270 [Xanthomonas vasicola pv. zeae]|uniref:Uncharacterized protein n=2 Tax=Xanthomonas vasicola pv. vasculorum TaxID=325776 RepID=A0A837B5J7_XANVA|nr:hypothetical protein [Xanthomonas vasicola]KFA14012.1 hypothetical protein KWS_0128195 [Xanthomonas vasicola pv. musacearum NCPPB 4384]AVQ07428.1 hypothetical protein C7V42_13210 [Xanthomonas vasicola pv. vasculorum]AZM71627.1 hypothetical protein CXP37_13220 [Xanthomonas vasicola pv. vasculorum]AZR27543.1 hypothetical protein NX80_014940 [Xanthomonas vasicola pv. arecae]AZR30667.1 hypothetical protein KWO_009130 [Xanthomonas vasicola pv. musacearum NCPPB 4379]
MRALRGAVALAVIALAGCATTQGPTSVPTNLKNGQSWIITRQGVAEQVLQTCSRDSPAKHPGQISGYWAPSHQQVEQLEARQDALTPTIAQPRAFDRQYVGVVIQGQRLIYINAFKLPNTPEVKPATEAIQVCDGGSMFWGALYDPQTGAFSQIAVNGSP